MTTIIANSTLYNRTEYGLKSPGDMFTVRDSLARDLMSRGLARPADPPRVVYETKVITPEAPEVSPRPLPFRLGTVPDEGQTGVDPDRDRVLEQPDVPEKRAPNRRKRKAAGSPGK